MGIIEVIILLAIVLVIAFALVHKKKPRVIRWAILSNPNGAEISWRIVSATPKVKNTNSNYIGTTPYETTEAFNIKGLSKSNSYQVQIEICCEKEGYASQIKRFNLGQVLEQCEISTKFNLIKDM